MKKLTFGFIGLGLIGGSIAKALRINHQECTIIAYDLNVSSLSLALEEGLIDIASKEPDDSFTNCDYLFLCAPVSHNDQNLTFLKKYLSPDCLITDVGSVKVQIHKHIDDLGLNKQFIGGHPMAGSERIGYANSKASLLENAYYILTPTKEVAIEKVTQYKELVIAMGAIPLLLSCEQHDYVTAAISHLPHVISASLVNLIKDSDSNDHIMKLIAAGGFKDITRISSSSPTMWQQISLSNHQNISLLLEKYIDELQKINRSIKEQNEDMLYSFFDDARSYRDSFLDSSSGPIKKAYTINVDIPDKAGALSTIAVLLAQHNINIKNIGIAHNREQEEGALRIEFHEEKAVMEANKLLLNNGYLIHLKK